MARTALTAFLIAAQTGSPVAGSRTFGAHYQAADAVLHNKVVWPASGALYALVKNTGATNPHTVTFTGLLDPWKRQALISSYSLAAGEEAVFGPFMASVWQDATDGLLIDADSAELSICPLVTP